MRNLPGLPADNPPHLPRLAIVIRSFQAAGQARATRKQFRHSTREEERLGESPFSPGYFVIQKQGRLAAESLIAMIE